MTLAKVILFLGLTLAGCSSVPSSKQIADTLQQTNTTNTSSSAALFPFVTENLNKKNSRENGRYYMFTPFAASTVKITWGNDTIKRSYSEPLELMFADRLRIEWSNSDYLILEYGVGTGAWETVALPMNTNEEVQVFDNGLSFDTKNNLLAIEYGRTLF